LQVELLVTEMKARLLCIKYEVNYIHLKALGICKGTTLMNPSSSLEETRLRDCLGHVKTHLFY